jgi:hypothetical protein
MHAARASAGDSACVFQGWDEVFGNRMPSNVERGGCMLPARDWVDYMSERLTCIPSLQAI